MHPHSVWCARGSSGGDLRWAWGVRLLPAVLIRDGAMARRAGRAGTARGTAGRAGSKQRTRLHPPRLGTHTGVAVSLSRGSRLRCPEGSWPRSRPEPNPDRIKQRRVVPKQRAKSRATPAHARAKSPTHPALPPTERSPLKARTHANHSTSPRHQRSCHTS